MAARPAPLIGAVALLGLLPAAQCVPVVEILESCTDGVDNDRDGAADCEDSGCAGRPDCRGALVFSDAFTDRHYWIEDGPFDEEASGDTGLFSWGGDVDGDGLTDVSLTRYRWYDLQPPDSTADIVAVPSSWIEDRDVVDVDAASLRIDGMDDGLCWPSTTTLCDIDGDGYDDLVQLDTWWPGIWDIDVPMTRPLSLGLLMGGPWGADHPRKPSRLPLGAIAGVMQIVQCAGDVDGDGNGDLVLSAGSAKWLLDGPALAAGVAPAQAVRRFWDPYPNQRLVAAGDLDGDGYDDLFFRRGPWYSSCVLDAEWPYGAVLPGGPHLLEPRTGEVSIYDEARPAVDLWVEAQPTEECLSLESNILHAGLEDLDGDGRAEFMRSRVYPGVGIDGWRGTAFGDLSEDLLLLSTDADMLLSNSPGRAGIGGAQAADIDGDGAVDIVANGGAILVPGSAPWLSHDRPAGSGLAVFFGGGSRDRIALAWEDADVFIADEEVFGGTFRIVEDRDGDGFLEIGFITGLRYRSEEPLGLPTAAFIPGSALVPFKR